MNTTTTAITTPVRSSFIRFLDTKYVKNLVKEAKRVKYNVEIGRTSSDESGSIIWYDVRDPEHSNSLVFKTVQVQPNYWATTFSKVYWQEPV